MPPPAPSLDIGVGDDDDQQAEERYAAELAGSAQAEAVAEIIVHEAGHKVKGEPFLLNPL